ncbi:2'-5' RNA ligase family protein [Belliella kenyensis]|uniref:2'-5' RNA ligase family protein n=1 Tax=Belliella kenyensis TaxID=1472724 RepID=A0ABV8EPL1_9BACT|nr:2'-5' RNA ligase family protein [Belliella kenyensis]MCH7401601.1 2'-5' RNA ligase family protein [Belliella kenyensis]MDN3603119.1 2'-5' RNA ligase family protein [Belliella kenyensis]
MAKIIGKYFIAWIPSSEVIAKVDSIKNSLKDNFGLKYALKSPPHITLKMPFSWNEAKEHLLIQNLQKFLSHENDFTLDLDGFGKFGKRVIFIKVSRSEELVQLQSRLVQHCKQELKLVKELSDSNYHPHMTIAFKDLKTRAFEEYWNYVCKLTFCQQNQTGKIVLLKKIENSWSFFENLKSQDTLIL